MQNRTGIIKEIDSVRYNQVNGISLNEVLKSTAHSISRREVKSITRPISVSFSGYSMP